MNIGVPRLRMFAGPNGSGKSTLKTMVRPELLGIYVNPDEIEKEIRIQGFLDFHAYYFTTSEQQILHFLKESALLASSFEGVNSLQFDANKLYFHDVIVNSYFASVIADFIR